MKAAIIGLRKISYSDFEKYMPQKITEIIWSGENEILCKYANKKGIRLTSLPLGTGYGRAEKFMWEMEGVRAADVVIAFWDGEDMNVKAVIDYCKEINKNVELIIL